MSEMQLDNLPSEVKELPQDAQNIFMAAFKSCQEDGMSQEGALSVAWNTVKHEYEQGEDGNWQRKPEPTHVQHKSVQSGGN